MANNRKVVVEQQWAQQQAKRDAKRARSNAYLADRLSRIITRRIDKKAYMVKGENTIYLTIVAPVFSAKMPEERDQIIALINAKFSGQFHCVWVLSDFAYTCVTMCIQFN